MIHVLSLVSYNFLPARVGGQKGIALFNKYFSRHVKLTCITTKSNDPKEASYELLPKLSNSALRYINPYYFFLLKKVIQEKTITHLVLEHPYYGWLGFLVKQLLQKKVVLHAHNIEALRFRTVGKWWWKILWYYERWVHRYADTVFFIHDEDRAYAVRYFGLNQAKCHTITYGIEVNSPIPIQEKIMYANRLREFHRIPAHHHLLLFNGAFDYKPNLDALKKIVDTINPLLSKEPFSYTILICGRNIPVDITSRQTPNLVFAGFVDHVEDYFKAAVVFLNPVNDGGGIKTKLVEALGFNANAVSTKQGAIGVDPQLCGGKLAIVENEDWQQFAAKVVELCNVQRDTPPVFYEHFNWERIAKKAAEVLEK